ncbi:hypothetical protein ACSLVK_17160 [Photorhabdus tasmaniensis]|uniref:hypothetical protein n=1 Tax=Photorhabdus tasmaniensis TaxID=1004159 RepID=UPI004041DC11
MDTELSTLSLSNKLLLKGIKTQFNLNSHTNVEIRAFYFSTRGNIPKKSFHSQRLLTHFPASQSFALWCRSAVTQYHHHALSRLIP